MLTYKLKYILKIHLSLTKCLRIILLGDFYGKTAFYAITSISKRNHLVYGGVYVYPALLHM
jgi:hypothetical protein